LASAAAPLQLVNGEFFGLGTGLPYNPASGQFAGADFTLTAANGTRYLHDVTDGLQAIVAANGTRIVWSASGAVAPDGTRVSFVHDQAGRLTSVISPSGEQIRYRYDAAGNLASVNRLATEERSTYGYSEAQPHLLTTAVLPAPASGALVRYDAAGSLQSTA